MQSVDSVGGDIGLGGATAGSVHDSAVQDSQNNKLLVLMANEQNAMLSGAIRRRTTPWLASRRNTGI